MAVHIIGRYSEIFLKKGRRSYFLNVLRSNLRAALADLPGCKVSTPYGRILIESDDHSPDEIIQRTKRVFGLNDLAVAYIVERLPEESPEQLFERIAEKVIERAKVAKEDGAQTFRMSARRIDKMFSIRSSELAGELGARVLEAGVGLSVKLRGYDVNIEIEVRPEDVYVTAGRIPLHGGLPTASNGKAVLLLSGGIDSPVAGWLTQKRGVRIDAVTFDSFPLTGPQVQEKVRSLARILSGWSPALTLHVVPFGDLQMMFRDYVPARLLLLLYRRSMLRMADQLAQQSKAQALITGECIGQVASQTLYNLRAVEAVTPTPVLRPLITYDKSEVVTLAEDLGTYPISIQPHQDCCSLFVPAHPELKGDAGRLQALEDRLDDLASLEEKALQARETYYFPPYGIGEIRKKDGSS